MALPEWIHHQHLVQAGSAQQHQRGQRQTVPLLVSGVESILVQYFTEQPLPGLVTVEMNQIDTEDSRVKLKSIFMEIGSNSFRQR